jgi:segregation and condensation protein B
MATLDSKLEAVLFHQGEPVSRAYLLKILETTPDALDAAVSVLTEGLAHRGIRLLMIDNQLELITAPEVSEVIAKTRKEELVRDLGKAGSETLSIILYRGPISRTEIEYIRGVNCSFIVRNLLIRGLVERVAHPTNTRAIQYVGTPKLLKHLGVARVEELPEFEKIRAEITAFEAQHGEEAEEH